MRIGILTLHSGANYGGTLQCYSLFKILQDKGHNVKVIDFVPECVAPLYKRIFYRITSTSFNELIGELFSKKSNSGIKVTSSKLCHIFDEFRRNQLELTQRVNEFTISNINTDFDTIIVGSDQVWSSYVREKLTYFGEWSPMYKGNLISYAACTTNNNYPIARKSKLKELLNRFNAISVRDATSKSIIGQLVPNRDIRIVLDPTQLYDFPEVINSASPFPYPYILTYVLGQDLRDGNKQAIDIIKKQISDANVKVIAITTYDTDIDYADITLKAVSPLEWVRLIKHAAAVFTDSFHASVFAIKFRTPCVGYYAEMNRSSRLINLYEESNLNAYLINNATDKHSLNFNFEVQYSNIKVQDKNLSFEYLNNNI